MVLGPRSDLVEARFGRLYQALPVRLTRFGLANSLLNNFARRTKQLNFYLRLLRHRSWFALSVLKLKAEFDWIAGASPLRWWFDRNLQRGANRCSCFLRELSLQREAGDNQQ